MTVLPTQPQPELPWFCEWWPLGSAAPCYAPAEFLLVRPSGETLRFTCAAHRDAWAERVRGASSVLERTAWEAQGGGYRGQMLGG